MFGNKTHVSVKKLSWLYQESVISVQGLRLAMQGVRYGSALREICQGEILPVTEETRAMTKSLQRRCSYCQAQKQKNKVQIQSK